VHENSKRFKKTLCRNRSLLILLKTPSLARRTGMDTDRFCRVLLGKCFAASHKFRTGPSQCPCSDELSAILSIIIGKTPTGNILILVVAPGSSPCSGLYSLLTSVFHSMSRVRQPFTPPGTVCRSHIATFSLSLMCFVTLLSLASKFG